MYAMKPTPDLHKSFLFPKLELNPYYVYDTEYSLNCIKRRYWEQRERMINSCNNEEYF